ncbi:MAG TPA: hypothetical protein PKY10_07830, partial [Lentisphaeria bacterium]|nr:hypothetical protein [Lentisphaeria bacterium]
MATKKFLARLFFWARPAQGVFFGMTMLMALPWIYFTFLYVLSGSEYMRNWVFHSSLAASIPFIIVGIPLYTLFVYAKSLGQTISPQTRLTWRFLRWGFICVLFLLPFVLGYFSIDDFSILFGDFALFSFCILLFLFGSAFLFPSSGSKWKSVAIVLLWPMGFTGLCLMFAYGVLPFIMVYGKLPNGASLVHYHDHKWLAILRDFFMISGVGWKWLAIITFLCLFAGYVLQTQALCYFWMVAYKKLLSKRALFVLILCLLIYLVSLPFALFEEAKYKHSLGRLEQHFGKVISVQTLENEYCWGGQAAEQSWEELKQALDKMTLAQKKNFNLTYYDYVNIDPLTSEWEGELYKKWETFYLHQKEIKYINDFLDEIPPTPRQWRDLALIELCGWGFPDLGALNLCFDAQLWQLRFAMEHRDAYNAHLLFARMKNICSYRYKDGSPSYQKYLLALCCFIESGLADEQWVDSQLDLFSKLEADSASLEERVQFNEVVRLCAVVDGVVHRLGESIAKGAELSQLRWFFPQVWWPASASANATLRDLEDYLSTGTTSPANSPETISERTIARIRNQIKRANIQVSCAKVLLEAEKIKRQTGSYPKQMPSLPTDHYTQKPLRYDVGTFEFDIQFVYDSASK